jgi:hypothetical protein
MLPAPGLKSGAARLYFAALVLCPPSFRREFSAEMALDLEDAIRDARATGRRREMLALCAIVGADLAATVIVQWLRRGLPVLFVVSVMAAVGAIHTAAYALPYRVFVIPSAPADADLAALYVLIVGVLFIIFATILFSFWFSGPFLRRLRR